MPNPQSFSCQTCEYFMCSVGSAACNALHTPGDDVTECVDWMAKNPFHDYLAGLANIRRNRMRRLDGEGSARPNERAIAAPSRSGDFLRALLEIDRGATEAFDLRRQLEGMTEQARQSASKQP